MLAVFCPEFSFSFHGRDFTGSKTAEQRCRAEQLYEKAKDSSADRVGAELRNRRGSCLSVVGTGSVNRAAGSFGYCKLDGKLNLLPVANRRREQEF
jgi:hypothetical protein